MEGTENREVLRQLVENVRNDFSHLRNRYMREWGLPLTERLKRGRCVAGLRLEKYSGEGVYRFLCEENSSDLREGDIVRLSEGDPNFPVIKGATIFRDAPKLLELRIDGDTRQCEQELAGRSLVLDVDYIDLKRFYLDAIEALGKTGVGRERILPLLLPPDSDQAPDSAIDAEMAEELTDKAETEGANDAQAEAIGYGAAAEHYYLVHGPPGTGKTRVLAHVVRERVAKGERVLITSLTHRAINNALAAVARYMEPGTSIGRVGPVFVDEELNAAGVEQKENFRELSFSNSGGEYVIGATPFATRSKRLKGVEFDTVIFDEASQVTTALAVMGMLAGRTYLFFGDDRQMPPIVNGLEQREAKEHSIFHRLKGRGMDTMLEITYRMNAAITKWPSENFYWGELRADRGNAARKLALPLMEQPLNKALDPEQPLVCIPGSVGEGHRRNYEEGAIILTLLRELVEHGVDLADAGVVVPFRRQARWIRLRMASDPVLKLHDYASCTIDTVERMQGQEREVVICSMTASAPSFIAKLADFLYQPERLNVTVTRARSKFIWIVSEAFFAQEFGSSGMRENQALFRSLREACIEVSV